MILELKRPLISLDTETTGIHTQIDHIVQIGLIKVYPDGKCTQWNVLVNPGIPIPQEATAVHGISDGHVIHAPRFASKEIAGVLAQGLPNCDITGYNVQFDLRFLKKEFQRAKMATPAWGEVVDPSRIFHLMMKRTLTAAVREFLQEDFLDAHNAMADATASLRVLEAQLLRWPHLPRDVDGLSRMLNSTEMNHIDPQGKLAWRYGEAIINFGNRYLGCPLRMLDHRYMDWILSNDFSPQVKSIIQEAKEGRFPRKHND